MTEETKQKMDLFRGRLSASGLATSRGPGPGRSTCSARQAPQGGARASHQLPSQSPGALSSRTQFVGRPVFTKSEFRRFPTCKCFYVPSFKCLCFLRLINCLQGTCCQHLIFIEQFCREHGRVSAYSSCLMLRIIFRIF